MDIIVPEPRQTPLKIFGVDVFLQERTKESRRSIESAYAQRNGADTDVLDFPLTFKLIESALISNLRSPLRIHFLKWYHPIRWNTLFSWEYLSMKLTESQVIFLIDQINKLDFGEKLYEELKKKTSLKPPETSLATK